jgi:glycerol-3-phosphate acyltransferase PlsY
MNNMLFILIIIVIYLIAATPTGVVLMRLTGGEDVRQKGSGNIGATNVYRVAGKLAGVLTLLGDTLKGFLPLVVFKSWLQPTPAQLGIASAVAILGHCYPVYLKFKGGKGVATALGIFLVLSTLFIAALVIWRHNSNIRRLLDGTETRFKA